MGQFISSHLYKLVLVNITNVSLWDNPLDFSEQILTVVSFRLIQKLAAIIKDEKMCSWSLGMIFTWKYLQGELIFK